jgi:hypothetical protein
MPSLRLSDGEVVQVSPEIYISSGRISHTDWINKLTNQPYYSTTALWRKIGGLWGHSEIGWHADQSEGWNCYIPLALCYDGVNRNNKVYSIYCGIHKSYVRILNTHPLNMRRQ